jgi:hypothetical protein
LFFLKLSERSNNPVYNLLGDIIGVFSQDHDQQQQGVASSSSSSSTPLRTLSEDEFKTTMHFLLSFVQKDK